MFIINSIHPVENHHLPPENDSELVIGLVGAVGTNLDIIKNHVKDVLHAFNYDYEEIRISSDIISTIRTTSDTKDNYTKISSLMTEGNKVRKIHLIDFFGI